MLNKIQLAFIFLDVFLYRCSGIHSIYIEREIERGREHIAYELFPRNDIITHSSCPFVYLTIHLRHLFNSVHLNIPHSF